MLRPGGRFVTADNDLAKAPTEKAGASYGRWGEADYRRMFEDAGFTDLVIHFGRGGLFARGRKPTASSPSLTEMASGW